MLYGLSGPWCCVKSSSGRSVYVLFFSIKSQLNLYGPQKIWNILLFDYIKKKICTKSNYIFWLFLILNWCKKYFPAPVTFIEFSSTAWKKDIFGAFPHHWWVRYVSSRWGWPEISQIHASILFFFHFRGEGAVMGVLFFFSETVFLLFSDTPEENEVFIVKVDLWSSEHEAMINWKLFPKK